MREPRAVIVAFGAALAACCLAPATGFAHGLVGRADLPVPEWLFGWAAAVVLVASFVALAVLWPEPRLEQAPRRRLTALPRWLDPIFGALGLAAFAAVVYSGLAGTQTPTANLAPTAIYVHFWVGVAVCSALFGNVFAVLNPWRALARAGRWLTRRASSRPQSEPLPYPPTLGRWPAAVGLLAFAWVELAWSGGDDPATLAILALAYAAIQLLGMSLYGIEPWSQRGDSFGVYFGLLARLSPLQHRDGALWLRPPLSGLSSVEVVPGTLALLLVAIGSTAFDGLGEGALWSSISPGLQDFFKGLGVGAGTALEFGFTVGLLASVAVVAAFYRAGIAGMRRLDGSPAGAELARRFVISLVPIAFAYLLAHYFSLLAYEGQALAYLASDPLGNGSDLLGTAGQQIDYGWISATGIWYVQVGALVAGHVGALVVAHDRALAIWPRAREATRSQYFMLVVMLGFTSLGLWLLSAANA